MAFTEVEIEGTKFNAEYDPNNAKVLSISYNSQNCTEYMGDVEYNYFYEEVQELISQMVE